MYQFFNVLVGYCFSVLVCQCVIVLMCCTVVGLHYFCVFVVLWFFFVMMWWYVYLLVCQYVDALQSWAETKTDWLDTSIWENKAEIKVRWTNSQFSFKLFLLVTQIRKIAPFLFFRLSIGPGHNDKHLHHKVASQCLAPHWTEACWLWSNGPWLKNSASHWYSIHQKSNVW